GSKMCNGEAAVFVFGCNRGAHRMRSFVIRSSSEESIEIARRLGVTRLIFHLDGTFQGGEITCIHSQNLVERLQGFLVVAELFFSQRTQRQDAFVCWACV